MIVGALLIQGAIGATDSDTIAYEVKAEDARLNRLVTGQPTEFVQGVPAEPVHSFVWDGNGSVPVQGSATVEIDPATNSGEIEASWVDENGEWTFRQRHFVPPEHPSGLHVGSSLELGRGNPSAAASASLVSSP